MKYFPQRLWLGFNSRRPSKSEVAFKEWDRNFRIYKRSLRRILPKLSPAARKFFGNPLLLHDGTLKRMEFGDQIDDVLVRRRKNNWDSRGARVRFSVPLANVRYVYALHYEILRRVALEFPGPISLFPVGLHPNFGDWGYDELSLKGKKVLKHEIPFASGATISIECEKISVKRRRLAVR